MATLGFAKSPRHTTPAATMSQQVDPEVKAERAELEDCLRERYLATLVGMKMQALVESPGEHTGRMLGTNCRYAPCEVAGTTADIGRFVPMQAGSVVDGRLLGERLPVGHHELC